MCAAGGSPARPAAACLQHFETHPRGVFTGRAVELRTGSRCAPGRWRHRCESEAQEGSVDSAESMRPLQGLKGFDAPPFRFCPLRLGSGALPLVFITALVVDPLRARAQHLFGTVQQRLHDLLKLLLDLAAFAVAPFEQRTLCPAAMATQRVTATGFGAVSRRGSPGLCTRRRSLASLKSKWSARGYSVRRPCVRSSSGRLRPFEGGCGLGKPLEESQPSPGAVKLEVLSLPAPTVREMPNALASAYGVGTRLVRRARRG